MDPYVYVTSITSIVVSLIGIVSNILCLVIFSRKKFSKNSISTYCRALAVFDLLSNYQLVVEIGLLYDVYLPYTSDGFCKFYFYSVSTIPTIPAWILVAFSIDKMLNLRRKQIDLLRNQRFQWLIVTLLILVHMLIYIELPIDMKLVPIANPFGAYYCDPSTLSYFKPLMTFFLFEAYLIPLGLMVGASVASIYMIHKSTKSLERGGNVDKTRRTRDIKYAISSITLNVLYSALKAPYTIVYILFIFQVYTDVHAQLIAQLVFYTTFSITFFMHLASNSLFRREFLEMFRCQKTNRIDTEHVTLKITEPNI